MGGVLTGEDANCVLSGLTILVSALCLFVVEDPSSYCQEQDVDENMMMFGVWRGRRRVFPEWFKFQIYFSYSNNNKKD